MDAWEAYFIPGTTVLKNLAGIDDARELQRFEYEQSGFRHLELQASPIQGRFDLAHLQAIHRHLFRDVYPWAGELRNVAIVKDGTRFALPQHLESFGARIASDLAKDGFLKGLDKGAFVDRLGYHYGELNALHPFREGNGRSTRAFLEQLCEQAGYHLMMKGVDPRRWNAAAAASFDRELGPIREIFAQAVVPQRAYAFEHDTREEALSKHPELSVVFRELDAAKAYAERLLPDPLMRAPFLDQVRAQMAERIRAGQLPDGQSRNYADPPSPARRDLSQEGYERER